MSVFFFYVSFLKSEIAEFEAAVSVALFAIICQS